MNETERNALVDELAAAIADDWLTFTVEHGRIPGSKETATACLPVIERLIAEKLADKAHEIKEL